MTHVKHVRGNQGNFSKEILSNNTWSNVGCQMLGEFHFRCDKSI